WASVIPKYMHCWLGQAKPSVCIRFGAPRRLLISHQGRTGVAAGPAPNAEVEARRQAGQSSGSGASADGGACCVWPRLVRRKAEVGTSPEAEAARERAGDKP